MKRPKKYKKLVEGQRCEFVYVRDTEYHSNGDRCDKEYYYAKTKYCSIHSSQLSRKKKHLMSPNGVVCIKCKKWKALPYNFLKNSKVCNISEATIY